MRCGAFHRVEGTLCLVRHGQAALSGSKTKAPGFAGGYLLAVQFFPFGPRRGQTHQEEATRDIKVVVPGLGSSADVPIPPLSRETVRARTVAARSATGVTRKAAASPKVKGNKAHTKIN